MSKGKYGCGGRMDKLAKAIATWSVSKGWKTNWRNVPEKLMLVVTELAEAMEWYRHLSPGDFEELELYPGAQDVASEKGSDALHSFRVEIADAIIRLLNLSASLGIDIEAEIAAKMEINENRPFKHGGKNC